jgi:hypothetical protein
LGGFSDHSLLLRRAYPDQITNYHHARGDAHTNLKRHIVSRAKDRHRFDKR